MEIHLLKSKKIKNKKSQRYINTPTHKQTQTDNQQREIGAYRNDRYLTGTIEARGYTSKIQNLHILFQNHSISVFVKMSKYT